MKTTDTTKLLAILFLALFFVAGAYAQNETRCDTAADKDCPQIEKKTAPNDGVKTDKETTKTEIIQNSFSPSAANPEIAPVSFRASSGDFKSSAVKEAYCQLGKKSASANGEPQTQSDSLAKQLANPLASLINLPFQSTFDFGMGPNKDGFRYTLNVQPVIPVALNKNWNLISRTIVPIIGQKNVVGASSQFGLGDVLQSVFISPNKSQPLIWGAGPVILVPTATNKYLGAQKLAIGPTFIVMKQSGPWSVGVLANHLWSVAGKNSREDVNSTFFQPFVSYTTKTAWTFNLNTETTYDWVSDKPLIPFHFTVSKLAKFGKQPVSVGGTLRCWAATVAGAPRWCGFRLTFTPLFPKSRG